MVLSLGPLRCHKSIPSFPLLPYYSWGWQFARVRGDNQGWWQAIVSSLKWIQCQGRQGQGELCADYPESLWKNHGKHCLSQQWAQCMGWMPCCAELGGVMSWVGRGTHVYLLTTGVCLEGGRGWLWQWGALCSSSLIFFRPGFARPCESVDGPNLGGLLLATIPTPHSWEEISKVSLENREP
jgi:hypothetical protein